MASLGPGARPARVPDRRFGWWGVANPPPRGSGGVGWRTNGSVAAITPAAIAEPGGVTQPLAARRHSSSAAESSLSMRSSAGPAGPGSGSRHAARAMAMNGRLRPKSGGGPAPSAAANAIRT